MNIAITKKQIDNLKSEYKKQQIEIKEKLELIKNGAEFGEDATDPLMYGYDIVNGQTPYYPSKLIRVINEETGLIEYEEHGVKQKTVLELIVVGYNK